MNPNPAAREGATAEPRRVSSALILASVVTLAAVIPLAILALRADDDNAAPTAGLTVDLDNGPEALSGVVIGRDEDAALRIDGDDLIAAAWSLMTPDGFLLAEGRSVGAPPYPVDLPAGLLGGLDDGLYDLLVTVTLEDGSTDRRAARFAVGDD